MPPITIGGQFNEQPTRGLRLFGLVPLGHDSGLALIYGVLLGGWFLSLTANILVLTDCFSDYRIQISFASALIMAVIFILDLLGLDGTFERITDIF